MALLHNVREVSVTEAARRGVAGLVADAEHGANLVVTRRHQPVAYVVSVERAAGLDKVAEDLLDLALVLARTVTDSGQRIALDEVIAAFGHTREPVPDWLAKRLIYTVGLPAEAVAALSLEEAVDRWADYTRTGK